MKPLPDPARSLAGCPEVIFIVYCLPADAEGRGYADWLYRVDMPFFNAIPGVHHYANWRIADVLRGERPLWDWFDFQGLVSGTALESVWFNPDLDEFRANWVKLWGYGHADPPPVLRHAYLMRSMTARPPDRPWSEALLAGGQGDAPTLAPGSAGFTWQIHTTLHKHFIGRDPTRPWQTPSDAFNPLGLDWIVCLAPDASLPDEARCAARVTVVAAPDQGPII
jgi:hypothetical protein